MPETTLIDQAFENLNMTLDKRLLNPEFWQSTSSIEDYCNAILANFDKADQSVKIVFQGAGYVRWNTGNNQNVITLRPLPLVASLKNKEVFEKAIIFRSVALRHELAHVIFSDHREKNILTDNELKTVFACVEDSRVENLFSKTMKGAKYNFSRILKPFFDKSLEEIVMTQRPSIASIFRYFNFRCAGYSYVINEVTSAYEQFFNKYHSVIDELSCQQAYKTYKTMYAEAKEIVADLKKRVKEQPKKEVVEDDIDDQSYEEENHDDDNMDEGENQTSDEAASDVSDDESDENDPDGTKGEVEIDIPAFDIKKDEQKEESNESSESVEADTENSNSKNSVEDAEDKEESDNESNEEESDSENEEEENKNLDIMDELTKHFDSLSNENRLFSFEEASISFDGIENKTAELYLSALHKKTKSQSDIFNSMAGLPVYRQTVLKYTKAINDLTRLFKLKLQSRSKVRENSFQEEGEIDQSNLKEFIVNRQSPRGFIKQLRTITPASNILILIDISGSMTSRIGTCLANACILMETCKRLNINYQISMFSSSLPSITLKDNVKVKEANIGKNIKINAGKVFSNGRARVSTIKRLNEKHAQIHEVILGNLINVNIKKHGQGIGSGWMHSTPEFQSLHHIYATYKKTIKNAILFVINDGAYDGVDEFKEISSKTYMNSLGRIYVQNDFEDAIKTLHSMIDEIEKIDVVEAVENALRRYSYTNVKATPEEIKKSKNEIIQWMHDFADKIVESVDEKVIQGELFSVEYHVVNRDGHKKLYMHWKVKSCYSSDYQVSEDAPEDLKKTVSASYGNHFVKDVMFNFMTNLDSDASNTNHIIYKNYINKMRENNWKVLGIGIKSDAGKHYIGTSSFTVVDNTNDLNNQFVKNLEKIF